MALRQAYSSGQPVPFHGMFRTEKALGGSVAIQAGDLTTGSQVALFKVPAGFQVTGMAIDSPALDTNGSPTLTVSIGDSGSSTRFLNASTSFRAGAAGIGPAVGARGYQFATDTDLLLTATAGAATAAAGNVVVYLFGFINA